MSIYGKAIGLGSWRGLRVGLLVVAIAVGAALPARSAIITVDTTADESNTDGDCSLREAIASANGDAQVDNCVPSGGFGDDTIILPAGTYDLSTVGTQLTANDTTAPSPDYSQSLC